MSTTSADQVHVHVALPEEESEFTATSTTEPMIDPDPSSETDESEAGASVASPIIAVEVDADGDVRLENHEDQRRPEVLSSATATTSATTTPASDLTTDLSRPIWIVTTAALPWRTGTAVNPLLRALFLAQQGRPVTLVIPWLADAASRQRLYNHTFQTRDDQAAWIRQYCVERCNCTAEQTESLRIRFWEGAYNETFGSIFPVVDICATIPADEADICVLEEPEHLNWFRIIKPEVDDTTDDTKDSAKGGETATKEDHSLGWASKFRHVVGILHTNYGDYVRQYGLGFSAPALNSLSSLVVKAYCHRLIRLSATLPHLDPPKEVTCNVHGVRPEFLEPPIVTDRETGTNGSDSDGGDDDAQKRTYAPVYFIGKLIWAKGFEKVLELQEKYKAETKSYFSMDVYGAGQDEAAIQKAFFGRRHAAAQNTMADENSSNKAKVVFDQPTSLRDQLSQNSAGGGDKEDVLSTGESSTNNEEDGPTTTDLATTSPSTAVSYDDENEMCNVFFDPSTSCTQSEVVGAVPLEILGDISGKTYSTSIETAGAALRLIDSVISVGFEGEDNVKKSRGEALLKTMASAKTRFKWRRRSLPARFLGVQDHIIIRDIPEHKVFLNMSTSEVLCTTSAEALAMGKFVILPKHPSNEFFFQFPNCLAYETIDQCVLKLQYALDNEPEPMSETFKHVLSWEGATQRFLQAAAITVREDEEWKAAGLHEDSVKAAQFHVDTAKKSSYVGNFLRSKLLKQN